MSKLDSQLSLARDGFVDRYSCFIVKYSQTNAQLSIMTAFRAASILALAALFAVVENKFVMLPHSPPPFVGFNASPAATAVDEYDNSGGCGWTKRLNMTANVSSHRGYDGGRATSQTLELLPPPEPENGAVLDPEIGDWTVGEGNNADGSCDGILPKECIENIRANYRSAMSFVIGDEGRKGGLQASDGPI
ncbi:uncharacterized protein B0I36DRAFT_370275 [Microdochium trichocladiopsis]|uniref:Uncharacterized protein n=1 Tax=Microdochium trichocladiopsis TaxID=1682393 RepID=A0A9P8XQ97_9PEZI|nr:uncharacterized protein B0I36DRAFT_370275 [Microdochium trichocladiopsis]KAH7010676.1 hypothetical protein B0I36DRAFT_370275 [Microdochium trichocladiopsis]